ncbi:MAG: hypothetical protein A2252_07910 [Elusimicrobia bacterium RIFOXYA2_FULL_39_19]|nr:MAG: hypothetical protein A2252_07910 [Elusimicrobia bacterium RIFOXYA2_FULL_39_19]
MKKIAGLIILVIITGIFTASFLLKVNRNLKEQKYDKYDDTGLYIAESAVQYRYARMVAEGEKIPSFDRALQYPEGVQVFKEFTVFMEYIAGYSYRLVNYFNPNLKFHVFTIYFICFISTLPVIALYLISVLFAGQRAALMITAAYALHPSMFSRTTLQFPYESFAFPLLCFFLYFFMKSFISVKNNPIWALFSGLFLCIALASWHFSGFYYLVFVFCIILVLFLKDSREPMIFSLFVVTIMIFVTGFIVPVLRNKLFFISIPVLLSIFAVIYYKLKQQKHKVVALILSVIVIAIALIFNSQSGDYSHVYGLFIEKIRFFFGKPENPLVISLHSRLLWVAPFNSPNISDFLLYLFPEVFVILIIVFKQLINIKYLKNKQPIVLLSLMFLGWVLLYVLIERIVMVAVFFVFAGFSLMFVKNNRNSVKYSLLCLILVFEIYKTINGQHIIQKLDNLFNFQNNVPPIGYLQNKINLIYWIKNNTAENSVILSDIGLSPSFLTYAGKNIVLQPKFESISIRNKFAEYLKNLYLNEKEFYDYCRKYETEYFVYRVDYLLDETKNGYKYLAGYGKALPDESAVYLFHFYPQQLKYFRLLYRNTDYSVFQVVEKNKKTKIGYCRSPIYDINQYNFQKNKSGNSIDCHLVFEKIKLKNSMLREAQYCETIKPETAAKIYEEICGFYPESFTYSRLGAMSFVAGNIQKAIEGTSKALECDPEDYNALSNLIGYYVELNRLKEASIYVYSVKNKHHNNSYLHYNMGYYYLKLKQKETAKYYFSEVLRINPDDVEIRKLMDEL